MTGQDQKPKHHQLETWIDLPKRSSHQHAWTGTAKDLTPMERWTNENAAQQPWNAVAKFKKDIDWKECSRDGRALSMEAQNGSAHEGGK